MIKNFILKKFIFIILFSLLCGIMFSYCSKKTTSDLTTITVAITGNPTNLDTRYATDMASFYIINQIYRSMFYINDKLEIKKDLVTEYEQPNDLTFIFYLEENAYFSNGERLTTKDVKYTFSSILSEELASPYKTSLESVESITIIDEHTIKFKLSEPYAPFLTALARGIVPENLGGLSKQEFTRNPIGAGPFKLERWISDDRIVLTKNPHYSKHEIHAENIIFRILPDDNTRYLEIQQGNIDIAVNNVPHEFIPRIKNNQNFNVKTSPGLNYSYLGFHLENDILQNLKVRQAISYAIDRDDIIKNIHNNNTVRAYSMLAANHWAYEENVKKYYYNPNLSNELLDKAGYTKNEDGIRFNIEYKALNRESTRQIAEVIQQQLSKVGIKVNLRMFEWGTFYNDIREGNFQMFQMTWVGLTEPDIYHYVFHSENFPPIGGNRGRYVNKEIDHLTEAGRIELDFEKRKEIYSQIQLILAEDLPYVSLWYNKNIAVLHNRIKNFRIHPSANLIYLSRTKI